MYGNCVNLNKIVQEAFIVTINRKTQTYNFALPPPNFTKMLKTEVDPKIGHKFWRFVPNFNKIS